MTIVLQIVYQIPQILFVINKCVRLVRCCEENGIFVHWRSSPLTCKHLIIKPLWCRKSLTNWKTRNKNRLKCLLYRLIEVIRGQEPAKIIQAICKTEDSDPHPPKNTSEEASLIWPNNHLLFLNNLCRGLEN